MEVQKETEKQSSIQSILEFLFTTRAATSLKWRALKWMSGTTAFTRGTSSGGQHSWSRWRGGAFYRFTSQYGWVWATFKKVWTETWRCDWMFYVVLNVGIWKECSKKTRWSILETRSWSQTIKMEEKIAFSNQTGTVYFNMSLGYKVKNDRSQKR